MWISKECGTSFDNESTIQANPPKHQYTEKNSRAAIATQSKVHSKNNADPKQRNPARIDNPLSRSHNKNKRDLAEEGAAQKKTLQ
ncbi:hypothetical protein OAA27_00665 [bacterium]|nr:hypothetical protein [bacterium]